MEHARFFFSFLDSPEFGNWVYSIGGDYGIGTNLRSGTGGELPLFSGSFPAGWAAAATCAATDCTGWDHG